MKHLEEYYQLLVIAELPHMAEGLRAAVAGTPPPRYAYEEDRKFGSGMTIAMSADTAKIREPLYYDYGPCVTCWEDNGWLIVGANWVASTIVLSAKRIGAPTIYRWVERDGTAPAYNSVLHYSFRPKIGFPWEAPSADSSIDKWLGGPDTQDVRMVAVEDMAMPRMLTQEELARTKDKEDELWPIEAAREETRAITQECLVQALENARVTHYGGSEYRMYDEDGYITVQIREPRHIIAATGELARPSHEVWITLFRYDAKVK